ncbi:winged helix-turn-helix transcriptional regulator [Desulfovibrio sp. OttesenSCG-928-A18]|nr:winged helix-turn-helix transcriptional regulator [Desulfovibrio sp. OttesenSCG-928-A18]
MKYTPPAPDCPAREFTEQERAILRIVQKNLPDSLTPYADIAQEVGVTEGDVLRLLSELAQSGAIRRFGASLKHQKAGFTHNAMVAWIVSEEEAERAGAKAAEHPLISHCYYRPSDAADWPYELYTMIHGRHPDEYKEVIAALRQSTGLTEYAVLESLRELKKISMTYF